MQRNVPSVLAHATFRGGVQHRCNAAVALPFPCWTAPESLVGLVTPDNVGEMIMVRSVLARGGRPSWRMLRASATITE